MIQMEILASISLLMMSILKTTYYILELSKVHKDVMCNVVVLTNAGVAKLRTP
jgi:hypothetical protein